MTVDPKTFVTAKLSEITEALFKTGATEVVLALAEKDVVFFYRKENGKWGAVVWYNAGTVVNEMLKEMK